LTLRLGQRLHTGQPLEILTDIHNKELFTIVESFKKWRHYLKGTPFSTDVIMDHRNLTYFCKSKNLSYHQACWSEYLSQFNLQICFCPGVLSSKPDALTHRWDVYSKGADTSSPNSNRHLIFINQQVSTEARTGQLQDTLISPTPMLNDDLLLHNIRVALTEDPSVIQPPENLSHKGVNSLELGHNGLLRHNNRVFVSDTGDLRL